MRDLRHMGSDECVTDQVPSSVERNGGAIEVALGELVSRDAVLGWRKDILGARCAVVGGMVVGLVL